MDRETTINYMRKAVACHREDNTVCLGRCCCDCPHDYPVESIELIESALKLLEVEEDDKYIRIQDAVKLICEWGTRQERIGRYAVTIHELKQNTADMLDELSSADVVQVVRCRECVHFGEAECLMAYGGKEWTEEEGFCHMGERNE